MILNRYSLIMIWCTFQLAALSQGAVASDSALKSTINLSEVIISDSQDHSHASGIINQIDRQLRPTNSAQDLLGLVPGLFIAQHAGGGKAEQIFLRGFDCDHGTDFSLNIDGMPVNMVSHAHGQGYADFHFVIPETVDRLQVFKGTYAAAYGDFATAGAAEFTTKNALDKSVVKTEYGMFDTYRALVMLDLLQKKHLFSSLKENLYVAGEYNYTNSFLENKQHFSRLNIFSKYTGQLNSNNMLMISGSSFTSGWDASGQIPGRAVEDGTIGRFGSIDPTEGGSTGRINTNALLATALKGGGMIRNQGYFSHYDFNLYSNFTFLLNDSVNGDQINQVDGRNIYGYKFTYEKNGRVAGKRVKMVVGTGTRIDEGLISLRHSVKRTILDTFSVGRLFQQNASVYADETVYLTPKLSVNGGLRFDYFDFKFQNFQHDSLSGRRQVPKLSPKFSIYYDVSSSTQVFVRAGYGFHSNDARSVVSGIAGRNIPAALGAEAGSVFKIGKRIVVNGVLWALDLENELVYVGDEAIVEITGATRRVGTDLSVRWQLSRLLFADADLNYNHGRYKELPKGENFIPLAPSLTSTGGLTLKQPGGFNVGLRYRYMDSRPANEDNSVRALGYFLLDAVVNYTRPSYQLALSAENILNQSWNQAQFDTKSRLPGESQPVNELHYTPGTPFFIKGSVAFFF